MSIIDQTPGQKAEFLAAGLASGLAKASLAIGIGSFASARARGLTDSPLVIPSDSRMVITSSWSSVSTRGAAKYHQRDDLVDADLTLYPRSTFRAVNENGVATRWMIEDAGIFHVDAFGASENSDIYPIWLEMKAIGTRWRAVNNFAGASGRVVQFGMGSYRSSDTIQVHLRWQFKGLGSGEGSPLTKLSVAPDKDGFVINRHNTNGRQVVAADTYVGGDGSTISDMAIVSEGGTAIVHGVYSRARRTLQDLFIVGFKGQNVRNVASFTGDGQLGENSEAGNANDWQDIRVVVQGSGDHAFYNRGLDANSYLSLGCKVLSAGKAGFMMLDFLGGTMIGPAVHACGSNGKMFVSYNGGHWQYVQHDDSFSATVPGTNRLVWWYLGEGNSYPAWSASEKYDFAGPFYSNGGGGNAPQEMIGLYTESGYGLSVARGLATVRGGENQFTGDSQTEKRVGSNGAFNAYSSGVGFLKNLSNVGKVFANAIFGRYVYFRVGHGGENPNEAMAEWGSENSTNYGVTLDGNGDSSFTAGGAPVIRMTGAFTPTKAGRVAIQPYRPVFPAIILGGPSNDQRTLATVHPAPPSGDYGTGDVHFAAAPAVTKNLAWSCWDNTGAGTHYKAGALFIDAATTYDAPSLAPGASGPEVTISVPGAMPGDSARATIVGDSRGIRLEARVQDTNLVRFFPHNPNGNPNGTVDIANADVKIRVEKM